MQAGPFRNREALFWSACSTCASQTENIFENDRMQAIIIMVCKGIWLTWPQCCRRSLASRPEVIDSLRMHDPIQESQGQVEASASGQFTSCPVSFWLHL